MNKEIFLSRLDELLKDIPDSERIEALEYYREYFEDAGVENEEKVIKELGSPEEVAHNIRGEMAENKSLSTSQTERNHSENYRETYKEEYKEPEKKRNPAVTVLLIILLCVVAIPVGIPVVSGVLAAGVGVIAAMAGILIALFVVSIVFIVLAVAFMVIAVTQLVVTPILSALFVGLSFLFLGLGLLLLLGSIKICSFVIPAIIRAIVNLFSGIFNKKEVRAA